MLRKDRIQQAPLQKALLLTAGILGLLPANAMAKETTAIDALKLKPIQSGVAYDRPTAAEAKKCKISTENSQGQHGWVVRDPEGRVLRRFADTNKDKVVDRWSYFHDGIEVYRDIDSDFNGKVDQHRWLNTAGRRWALDRNGDGKVDLWRAISAEEATAEVVAALATSDSRRFSKILISKAELKSLGLGKTKHTQIEKALAGAESRFRSLASRNKSLSKKSRWVDFSSMQPGVVPAGDGGSKRDLIVYENVAAMVDTDGKQSLVYVGTMVRVGDSWRVLDVPRLSNGADSNVASNGTFFQIETASSSNPQTPGAAATQVLNDKVQKQLAEFDALTSKVATAPMSQRPALHKKRAKLLEALFDETKDATERENWARQLVDMLSTAAQSGEMSSGIDRLSKFSSKLEKKSADKDLAAYAQYRGLMAGYSSDMQAPKADFAEIQKKWLKDLNGFVKKFPKSTDTPEAMLQLAIAEEFAGEEESAKKWYSKIVSSFSTAPVAKKAQGSINRLNSVGKRIAVAGKDLKTGKPVALGSNVRGKLVVIQYWATWCEPCKADMEELTELVGKFGNKGFKVLGVNLDNDRNAARGYLSANKHPWPHLYEPGGLDSRLADEMGILTLPTMILVDGSGKVVNRNIHLGELESELKKRLK